MKTLTRYVLPALTVVFAVGALALGAQDQPSYSLFAWVVAGTCACGLAIVHSARLGVFLTALGCVGSLGYLLSRKWVEHTEPSLCTIGGKIDCDLVNSSAFSEAFGMPIALIGVAFYVGLAVAALGGPKSLPRFHQVNALFALLSLGYSVFLTLASISLGAICVMCVSVYVGNALLLIAGLKGLKETEQKLLDDLGGIFTSRSFLVITAVFAVFLLMGRSAWVVRGDSIAHVGRSDPPGTEALVKLYAQPHGEVAIDGTEPILGDPEAPYLVVEYADFACPHCGQAARDLKQVVEEYPQIQVRFKVFPLSGACNPMIEGTEGAERCLGAVAAECAGRQGKFWGMTDNMFRNMGYLSLDALRFMAEEEGLDIAEWEGCIHDPTAAAAVGQDIQAGLRAGVQGTPALFLRGAHGSDFVLITYTPADMLKVVRAHQAGTSLPQPRPAPLF
ncbi:MAG: thioredoxin domain-containing protein [Deltaproteobacteria bacterium]|nr:thioredoxin domain-containing protein [Deltaproteobacteria bacterium]MBW2253542.1 thioredoxin domain-containing protein [Deltaproteobacteria bacterium]